MKRKEMIKEEKVLDVDASIQGTISFKDPVNLRINGDFEGKLDTKGTLTIGDEASVVANIVGDHLFIAGKVTGNIIANESLTIVAPAHITGDIQTPSLSVSEGAIIEGKLSMGTASEEIETKTYGVQEIARYLEIEESALVDWAEQSKIPAYHQDGEWRFLKQEIDAWIQREKVQI